MRLSISILFLVGGSVLAACGSGPQPVTSSSPHEIPVDVDSRASMTANPNNQLGPGQAVSNYNQGVADHRMSFAVLSGKVMLKMENFPVGLAGIRLELSMKRQGKWQKNAELTSGREGEFSSNLALYPGQYRLRCLDKRYKGETKFNISDQPVTNLVVEVEKLNSTPQ